MRILHINTYQTGGAALCMQRIGKALQQHGVECRYLLMQGIDNEYTSIAPGDTDIWSKNIFVRFFQKIKYISLTLMYFFVHMGLFYNTNYIKSF